MQCDAEWCVVLGQAGIAILVPTLIGAAVAAFRHAALKTLQSTVDFLVVVLSLSLAMLFWPASLSGLYGATKETVALTGLQDFAGAMVLAATLGVLGSILWLEPMYSAYDKRPAWQQPAIYRIWLLSMAMTAALYALHIVVAVWPDFLTRYPWDLLKW